MFMHPSQPSNSSSPALCYAATPHNLHTPIAAARMRNLFPNAVALASLKEPVWRMRSAYNQFVGNFKRDCDARRPKEWCPVYKYYQLRPPSYAQMLQQELQYLQNSGAAPTCVCSAAGLVVLWW